MRYEAGQNFNALTRLLHGTRYRHLREIARSLMEGLDRPLRVVDIGAGTGSAFVELSALGPVEYVAVDPMQYFADILTERFSARPNFSLRFGSICDHYDCLQGADLIIALESLEHIPEHDVVRVVEEVARAGPRRFYVTVPNEIGPALLVKNVGSFLMGWGRWKEYSWRETWAAARYDLDSLPPHGTGHKGFDWRWLAQTIRHNMKIERTLRSPNQLVPLWLSPSVGFDCLPRAPGQAGAIRASRR